jgi:hypothetical protein
VSRRIPADSGSETFKVLPTAVHRLIPSIQTNIFTTDALLSVLAAAIFTGDVTIGFGAGKQIVTVRSGVAGLQGSWTADGTDKTIF